MRPRLLLSSLVLLVLAAPASADEITLAKAGITITVPSEDRWVNADGGSLEGWGSSITHLGAGDDRQFVTVGVRSYSCAAIFQAHSESDPSLEWTETPPSLSSSWSPRFLSASSGDSVLCLPLEHEVALVIDMFNALGGLQGMPPLIEKIERAVRHQRSEYESKYGLWLANAGFYMLFETDGAWWRSSDDNGIDTIERVYPAAPGTVLFSSKPAEVSNCDAERAVALAGGQEDPTLVYDLFGTGIRTADDMVAFCGHRDGVDYLVMWVEPMSSTGTEAEITRALLRALNVSPAASHSPEPVDHVVTAAEPPAPEPRDDDRGLPVRSSLVQPDVRAGVAFLSPAVGEAVTGFAVGASLPTRFVTRYLVVEGDAIFMHGGDVGTMLELHAGVGLGARFGGVEVAWTGGVGATGLGHLDDGGSEEGGGPHVYTGPYVRLDNRTFALGVEAAVLLSGHPDQSRVRVELTTSTWTRKLGVSVERTQAIDGSAVTVSLAVGLF